MDFFERQDKARRNTKWLVFYFVMAVVCIIGAVYLACLLIFAGLSSQHHSRDGRAGVTLWNPQIFSCAVLGTLAVVVCGSAYKMSELSTGGGAVARALGGRLVQPNTSDPDERKLLNVVEEMAIASGVPVPQVYVLDQEQGINAFAAGHTPSDAAIGVTRGCMRLLKRDELQGVIGHEFSHILNGDMRLNVRLIGMIFGILCLTVVGRIMLRTRGRKNPLPLLGLALILIGSVGVFFGRLIQAAVCRQREFLADASAVQFTRNPSGLSGALQKIGGLIYGSQLKTEHAAEASHLFFGNAMGQAFLNAFATHPPLEERIRAIDPGWDGTFPRVQAAGPDADLVAGAGRAAVAPQGTERMRAKASLRPAAAGLAPPLIRPQTVLPGLGQPTPLHLRYAEELRNSFPDDLQSAARSPEGAVALIYALLLSPDAATRRAQIAGLQERTPPEVFERITALLPQMAVVATRARLPLVELALPALRMLRPEEFGRFTQTLQWLIESDRQIDLFEYMLQKVIVRHLMPHFAKARPPVTQYYTLNPLLPDCAVLLSALA
ncbi:MAG: M48 family metallopeptidase, partial [Alteraurantiacibacter sp.]|nr:M48 family metallopeptidase [Alteraurantiacibacter sp.]